jgi:branched-subunit amino acid transport protein
VARRFFAYVPVAAFAALVAPGLGRSDHDLGPRLAAVAVAACVVLRFPRLWAYIGVGMAVYWFTRWVT